MQKINLEKYYNDIPIGKENAITYAELCFLWGKHIRSVREILEKLSYYDNGDNYILIRSSKNKGFYKTDDISDIMSYKKEYTHKAISNFAPSKKVNRVLKNGSNSVIQSNMYNTLKNTRLEQGLSQNMVVNKLIELGLEDFDTSILSRLENGYCLPTPQQLQALSIIYKKKSSDLILLDDISLYV